MKGQTRIFFLAGGRALTALANALKIQRALTVTLNAPTDQHIDAAAKLLNDKLALARDVKHLSIQLAQTIGGNYQRGRSLSVGTVRTSSACIIAQMTSAELLSMISDRLDLSNSIVSLILLTATTTADGADGNFLLRGKDQALVSQAGRDPDRMSQRTRRWS